MRARRKVREQEWREARICLSSCGRGDDKPIWLGDLRFITGVGRDALEAVGFVAPGYISFAEADDGETFGEIQARAVPPIAADGAAAGVLAIFVVHEFVDVEMTLQDGENVVRLEQGDHFGGIRDGDGVAARRAVWPGTVGEIAGDERDVSDYDYWRVRRDGREIVR